eukprot:COSAG05_NODE_4432_length_1519_cov_1.550000_1_plen_84_part_00
MRRATGVTIEQLLQKAATAPIALVKLDVEGSELHALEGALGLVQAGRIRHMLLELGSVEFWGACRMAETVSLIQFVLLFTIRC